MGEWQGIPSPGGAPEPDFRAHSFAPPGLLICDAAITHGSRRGLFSRAPPVLGLAVQRGADIECHEVPPGLRHSRLGFPAAGGNHPIHPGSHSSLHFSSDVEARPSRGSCGEVWFATNFAQRFQEQGAVLVAQENGFPPTRSLRGIEQTFSKPGQHANSHLWVTPLLFCR